MSFTISHETADVTAALQAALAAGDCTIHARPTPYVISATLTLPAGRKVRVEAGTVFLWAGPDNLNNGPIGLFELASDTEIACFHGDTFTLRASVATPLLVVARGRSVANVTLTGLYGSNCNQVHIFAADGLGYADVVTPEMAAAGDARSVNICRNIRIVGGGCSFDEPNLALAGCFVGYTYDFQIRDCSWRNTYCGVQFWGGDAGFAPFQQGSDLNAPRKCRTFTIDGCTMQDGGAGIWGSFGVDFTISDCRVYRLNDVGFDYEGCTNGRIVGCYAEECANGNYSSFSWSIGLLFEACSSRQSQKGAPHFRVYNSTQLPNARNIVWQGGFLECTDPTGFGSFDADAGCARSIKIEGATLVDTVIRLNANNLNQVYVLNNSLTFTRRASEAFSAVFTAGAHQTAGARPLTLIEGNRIYSEVAQPVGSYAINAYSDDFNGYPVYRMKDNVVEMDLDDGPAPMRAQHAGGNAGLTGRFVFEGNMLNGQIQTTSLGAGAPGSFAALNCYNELGVAVGLTAV